MAATPAKFSTKKALTMTLDHRVVDGQQGSQYLADVGALLANPSMAFTY